MQRVAEPERRTLAQWWFALTAAVVFVGVPMNAIVAYQNDEGFFSPGIARFFNTFAFFTIQSNLIVGVTCLLLAIDLVRPSTIFRAWRLAGLVGISITGVVYHWVLNEAHNPEGFAWVANLMAHYIVPIMAVIGFLGFGPRGQLTGRIVRLSLIFLVAWAVFTVIRGEIVGWYPYPFIDVIAHGYPRVIVNAIIISLAYVGVAFLYLLIDRALSRRAAAPARPASA